MFFLLFSLSQCISTVQRTISITERRQDALLEACWRPREEPRLQPLDVQVLQPSRQPSTTGSGTRIKAYQHCDKCTATMMAIAKSMLGGRDRPSSSGSKGTIHLYPLLFFSYSNTTLAFMSFLAPRLFCHCSFLSTSYILNSILSLFMYFYFTSNLSYPIFFFCAFYSLCFIILSIDFFSYVHSNR
jgi:hypothetical protein